MKILAKMEKNKNCWFLISTCFIFFLLRLPSLIEPYWYGDEGIYQIIGAALRQNRLLYRDIWDNKPPLLYLVYSLFQSDQFLIRAFSLLCGVFAVVAFFALSKKLFKNPSAFYSTTFLFALLFGTPLLEGNIANSENFMLFLTLCAGLIIFETQTKKITGNMQKNILAISGLLLAVSFLFKVVAVFDLAAFTLFILFMQIPSFSITRAKTALVALFTGFTIPIFLTFLFFLLSGALPDFLNATLKQNVGYVGYGNTFLFRNSLLIFKLVLLFLSLYSLSVYKKFLTPSVLFIALWLSFSLFNAFFSQRSYTHYLLVLLPSFLLLLGIVLDGAYDISSKHIQKIGVVCTIILLILISKYFNIYGKNLMYYKNFSDFVSSRKTVTSYQAFFDKKTPRDYQIAQYIKPRLTQKDNVFIWGNNAQLYTLLEKLPPGKFIVAYHITAFDETKDQTRKDLQTTQPRFVVLMPDMPHFPYSLFGYSLKLVIQEASIYERL